MVPARSSPIPDQILIVNGFAQGLAIVARLLAMTDITGIAVEEPGSIGIRNQLQDWGLTTPAADVDEEGLDVESLRATSSQVVLVTPSHQYPTGVALSASRRRYLLKWVSEEPHRLIIEDDYDAEYRYGHEPIGSLQAANPQQVITGASISKTLAPALSEYQQRKPARSGLVIDLSAFHSLEMIIAAILEDSPNSPTQ